MHDPMTLWRRFDYVLFGVTVFLIIFGIIGVFLLNNYDILTEHRRDPQDPIPVETARGMSRLSLRDDLEPSEEPDAVDSVDLVVSKAEKKPAKAPRQGVSDAEITFIVDIPPIIFDSPGRNGVAIRVSLRILLRSAETRREVLLKREEIKVVAHRLFGSPESADLSVQRLRNRLLDEINRLIESGHVDQIEFTEFSPVVRE